MKRETLQIQLNKEEEELVSRIRTEMKIKTGAQILRSALYALEEKILTKSRYITNKSKKHKGNTR